MWRRTKLKGLLGSLLLGMLFAMAFCSTNGVLYFGMLICKFYNRMKIFQKGINLIVAMLFIAVSIYILLYFTYKLYHNKKNRNIRPCNVLFYRALWNKYQFQFNKLFFSKYSLTCSFHRIIIVPFLRIIFIL